MRTAILKTADLDNNSSWKNSRKTLWGGGGGIQPPLYARGLNVELKDGSHSDESGKSRNVLCNNDVLVILYDDALKLHNCKCIQQRNSSFFQFQSNPINCVLASTVVFSRNHKCKWLCLYFFNCCHSCNAKHWGCLTQLRGFLEERNSVTEITSGVCVVVSSSTTFQRISDFFRLNKTIATDLA